MPAISASAPGKSILFGEHAVVYGYPAIAVPILDVNLSVIVQALPTDNRIQIVNRNLDEDFFLERDAPNNSYARALEAIRRNLAVKRLPAMRLTMSSNIPVASGLGSSAAFAVALTRSVTRFLGFDLTIERLNAIAFEIEKFQHGTPSGIDNTVITYQKPIFFQKDKPVEFLAPGAPLTLLFANSGIPSLTKEVVFQLRRQREENPALVNAQFDEIASITHRAREMITLGNHSEIGHLMLENHHCLRELGLSLPELDHLVDMAVEAGAFGAKLCGSGKGGNVAALIPHGERQTITDRLMTEGAAACLASTVKPSHIIP